LLKNPDIDYEFRLKNGMRYRAQCEVENFITGINMMHDTLEAGDRLTYEQLAGVVLEGEVMKKFDTEEGRYVEAAFDDGKTITFPEMLSKTPRLYRREE